MKNNEIEVICIKEWVYAAGDKFRLMRIYRARPLKFETYEIMDPHADTLYRRYLGWFVTTDEFKEQMAELFSEIFENLCNNEDRSKNKE